MVGIGRGVRETGQALERMGARAQDNWIFNEKLCRHRAVMNLFDQRPKMGGGVFVAPNAAVIGNVEIKDCSSIWCVDQPRERAHSRSTRTQTRSTARARARAWEGRRALRAE